MVLVCNFWNVWELWLFKLLASKLLLKFGCFDICMYTLKPFLSVFVRSSWVCHYDQHEYSWMYLPIFLLSMSLHMFPFVDLMYIICVLTLLKYSIAYILDVIIPGNLHPMFILWLEHMVNTYVHCFLCPWHMLFNVHVFIDLSFSP